jgi:hypothetical protein
MAVQTRKALRIVGGSEIEEPKFEATAVESFAIKRFLDFCQADIKFQFQAMNKTPGISRNELEMAQNHAVILANYVEALKGGLSIIDFSDKSEPA